MTQNLLFVELNEVNFPYVQAYIEKGRLPNLAALIKQSGVTETISEKKYEELEPWIQWVTAHTGKTLAEHGIFRLGDIVNHDIPQVWERLEEKGLCVGAMSPMNAKNRTQNAAFFIPDPWTPTQPKAGFLLGKLYAAVVQAVNDNAQSKLTLQSLGWLAVGAMRYARIRNYLKYFNFVLSSRRKPWAKAMFLDLFLADIFISEAKRTKPNFASLFLNAGAHIQHHYMFNASVYEGDQKNPEWYIDKAYDPIFEVYDLYDRIIGQLINEFPDSRLMIATGLHQDPHQKLTYYWRLLNHAEFLKKIGVSFKTVEPRMSRDFLIRCVNKEEAVSAEKVLRSARTLDGVDLFEVDNRGEDLFVMLTYPHDIPETLTYTVGNKSFEGLKQDVAFVAIKNGQHNGIGYFLDTGTKVDGSAMSIQLAKIPEKIEAALLSA